LIQNILISLILAAVISYSSFKLKFLTKDGSITTFFLGACILGFGGLQWSIPIFTFFLFSSILSKIIKRRQTEIKENFEKSSVRDSFQVIANGGLGGILVIINSFYPSSILYFIYLGSIATVCADTWATELGTNWKTNTYNPILFKIVQQGVSGGISLIGMLAALLGSIIIALSGVFWNDIEPTMYFTIIVSAGIIGCYFDSILGATIQIQYKCKVCKNIMERKNHCSEKTNYYKGLKWINNDVVNLLASCTGSVSVLIFLGLKFKI